MVNKFLVHYFRKFQVKYYRFLKVKLAEKIEQDTYDIF